MNRPLIALALAIFAATPIRSQELPAEIRARLLARNTDVRLARPLIRVPMRGSDNKGNRKCPYFQVSVNGTGRFTFLYDTGATYLIVSNKVAAAAHARMVFDRHGRRDVVQIDRLALGGVELSNVLAIVDDSWGVDGVMGFPTLGDAIVLVDLSRREVLVSRSPIPMKHAFTVRYTAPGGIDVPAIPVKIGRRTIPILIDTGDDAYGLEIRSIELGDAAIQHPPRPAGKVLNGASEQSTAVAALKDPVVLGPVEARNAEIAINDDLPVGDFGYDMLKQFRFQIDPKRHMVTFQPLFRGREFSLSTTRRHPTSP